ncbi:MAG: CDP-archaeol synthase [Chitinophagales bacterium]|nr:CDP-archaeol synthase [Chitinophagales bacterium]
MKTLFVRSASGLVFAVVMIGSILYHPFSYGMLMSIILTGSLVEFFRITTQKRGGEHRATLTVLLAHITFLLSFQLSRPPAAGLPDPSKPFSALLDVLLMQRDGTLAFTVLLPGVVFLLFARELFTKATNPFGNLGWSVLVLMWVLVPLMLTNQLYFDRQKGPVFLVTILGLIWLHDSACYAFGSVLGKHKLFERISPKKTIEGLLGGLIFTVGASYFINTIYTSLGVAHSLGQFQWMVLAFVICIAATFGDLVESLLKRSLAIKDSGSIMPGHGGFLDRFDAYFFAIPFVALLVWIFNRIDGLLMMIDFVK